MGDETTAPQPQGGEDAGAQGADATAQGAPGDAQGATGGQDGGIVVVEAVGNQIKRYTLFSTCDHFAGDILECR